MKKFLFEYKALRSKSETETSKEPRKVESAQEQDMGVFKWLRRERVTVTTHQNVEPATPEDRHSQSATNVGTIRTEEYKRDLAEFQARRSTGKELPETPVKKKCSRHSLPVSCTNCATDHDNTFNYEKKSAAKYKKKSHKRTRSSSQDDRPDCLPNIQFLFQNQVFMPGNLFPASYTEPQKTRRHSRQSHQSPEVEFTVKKQIDFDENQTISPPLFYKNNSLPYDAKSFLGCSRNEEEVDGVIRDDANVSASSRTSKDEKGDSSEERLWEVMSELKHFDQWADQQLQPCASKSDDSISDTSAFGLPVASACSLDVTLDRNETWSQGNWGVVPVQIKRIIGVSMELVKDKLNTEINILRKYRHPNIILLMGLYPDIQNNVHIICERCVDSLYGILHVQGRILTVQTSVQYALDIANALVFLQMQGFIHTALSSRAIMVTSHDAAKLADLGPCARLGKEKKKVEKGYEVFSIEPQYVNIEGTRECNTDSEPLISQHPSETYITGHAVARDYKSYRDSDMYRWQAPELFDPDEDGLVYPCAKSDVYSLCLVLWESCNAAIPSKNSTYNELKQQYMLWKTSVSLPQNGTYPGCLLALLQVGLKLARGERCDLQDLQTSLHNAKRDLDDIEYIIIPARVSKKISNFSSVAWDTNSPTDDSECQSPIAQNIRHEAIVHNTRDSSTESEKDTKSDASPVYEIIRNEKYTTCNFAVPEKCYISDDEEQILTKMRPFLKYDHLPEKDFSSACSTPIAKVRARIKDIGTPGALHRSDSTEYCSILSPEFRKFGLDNDSNKDQSAERSAAKLSRSFTPKSYKPLHIKVPECNLDSIKSILKDQNGSERSSYNFDIKNYSLPTTPIARSNKLRKNAWLSGDLCVIERRTEKKNSVKTPDNKGECNKAQSAPETPATPAKPALEKEENDESYLTRKLFIEEGSPESADLARLRRTDPPPDYSPETDEVTRCGTSSWSFKSSLERPSFKTKVEEEILATVNVKPLVAIHEKWIYEANRKTGRSLSLPENNRCQQSSAVKPASHCVDTLQKSLPQLNFSRTATKSFRPPASPGSGKSGSLSPQFCAARDSIAKSINFTARDPDRFHTWRKDSNSGKSTQETKTIKINQATDTHSIEDFIRDLIRKEFRHLLHEISDDASCSGAPKSDEIVNKGIANIIENLRGCDDAESVKKDSIKSFSRVKINGNNKPLLQITFTHSGENSLQVLDNCVNVTICDSNPSGRERHNVSMEDTLTTDDVQVHSLKRCQAFNALQEARSTEDLYIDDDLSAQMQENFGGKVKLIPLHGSLHEILCEKEDECCLIKVKQENGCDTIYFRCDNSDTESRDAIDGYLHDKRPQDTVVFKRSISLVEERIQRVFPTDKRPQAPLVSRRTKRVDEERGQETLKTRPKSEVLIQNQFSAESRVLSSSSPSLIMKDRTDEVEVNIENVMSYQDSSSEECLKCQLETEDFELLERKIEEDMAKSHLTPMSCGCLEKISEENLSVLTDEILERVE